MACIDPPTPESTARVTIYELSFDLVGFELFYPVEVFVFYIIKGFNAVRIDDWDA